MMSSNFFSRILRGTDGSRSIYETIQQYDDDSDVSDIEDRAALTVPERPSSPHIQLRRAGEPTGLGGTARTPKTLPSRHGPLRREKSGRQKQKGLGKRGRTGQQLLELDEEVDDVPASLLIEGEDEMHDDHQLPPPPSSRMPAIPLVGRATANTKAQWERTQAEHGLHRSTQNLPTQLPAPKQPVSRLGAVTPKDKAMWRWANVVDLDNFLFDVYNYFRGRGLWSILLGRLFSMATLAFMIGFCFYLTACIDYSKLRGSNHMAQILVPHCIRKMGLVANIVLWLAIFIWVINAFLYIADIRRLRNMRDFYFHLLGISEQEIQTTQWQDIVSRLMALRDANPSTATNPTTFKSRRLIGTQSKQRMDAHDIANRLMRRDNYMIAMINKEILDMTLPIPFFRNRQLFTRTLEWNINQCIMDYVFNQQGQVCRVFLKETERKELAEGLRRRFVFAGTTNLIIAPFLITYSLIENFFQNFTEYQQHPASIGMRQYSRFAEWKLREFNELPHLFERRINMSLPFAARYIDQFPKDKTVQAARFVTFVSGALLSILALLTLFDPELFLGFEITRDRNVLFYLGVFGSIWAVARGLLPEENMVIDPGFSLQEVIDFTHYKPAHWDGRLHTDEVRQEFSQLYQMRIVILLEEVLSMVFTPFVLWYSLPKCSERIIDFFREFTVHVEGMGHVCSFAEFNFKNNGSMVPVGTGAQANGAAVGGPGLRDDYYATKDQKLEASYWGFMNDYARNPKTDIRFPYVRHRYNPPPPFPGLLSPSLHPGGSANVAMPTGRPGSILNTTASLRRAPALSAGTPPFAAQVSTSPLTSILLDPHHQPPGSGFGSPQALRPRGAASSYAWHRELRRRHTQTADIEEEGPAEEAAEMTGSALPQVRGGRPEESGGELGSWKEDEDGSEDDDEDEAEDVAALTGAAKGAGVLGLIRQFQNAQGTHRNAPAGAIGL